MYPGVTLIPVLYRDAANYKAHGAISLTGMITDSQIATLRQCLRAGTYYVPAQLGLAHLADDTWYDDDDNWHEMLTDAITTSTEEREPAWDTQHFGTVEDFITELTAIAAGPGWDPNFT